MSRFTRFRDSITGTVGDVINTGVGLATNVLGAGLGGLGGLLGGGALPSPGGQMYGGTSQDFGRQQTIEGLQQLIGQQPQVTQIGPTQGGGLI